LNAVWDLEASRITHHKWDRDTLKLNSVAETQHYFVLHLSMMLPSFHLMQLRHIFSAVLRNKIYFWNFF
jgi:hypothetical protein